MDLVLTRPSWIIMTISGKLFYTGSITNKRGLSNNLMFLVSHCVNLKNPYLSVLPNKLLSYIAKLENPLIFINFN